MTKITNTFNQGMDKDSSKKKYDNTHYYEAKNMRLVTQEGLSGGAIENIRGTQYRLNVDPEPIGSYICGDVVLGDYLILWTTTNNTSTPNGTSVDRIWKIPIADLEALTGTDVYTLDTNFFWNGGNFIYQGNMGLCTSNLITTIARYDNDNVQKVYWVDGYNRLRHINVVYNSDTNDLINIGLDKLEAIGDISLTQPLITDIVGGNLVSGKIQYVYQLYAVHGAETTFSTVSNLVNLAAYPETAPTSESYRGSDIDTPSGKAVRCSITIDSVGYTRMRIVAIHYTSLAGDPEVRIVEEREISGSPETIYFTDTGNTVGSLLLEDIRTVGTLLFSASQLETKDNILFPANITEESFDVDYDARAYRFAGVSAVNTEPNFNEVAALRRMSQLYQEDGTYYEVDGNTKATTLEPAGTSIGSWSDIPDDADCINKFNDLDNDGYHEYRFMYQSDGTVPGGQGPNVTYKFKIKEAPIDNYTTTYQRLFTVVEGTVDNPSYYGYASPFNVAKYVGYHRDEIYRFGIVFFDDKGRGSFVKWINDIRMPSISTLSDVNMYNVGGGTGGVNQEGTIYINYEGPYNDYRLQITGSDSNVYTFSYDNSVTGFDRTTVGNIIRNQIAISYVGINDVTQSSNVGGLWTITWDKTPGAYTVNDYGGTYINFTQTATYVAGTAASNDHTTAWYDGDKIVANVLYPHFTVTNIPAGVSSYQIVRVRRESYDRTVMAQGVIGHVVGGIPQNWDDGVGSDFYTLNSPEVAFNKNLALQGNDRLQEVGEFFDNLQTNIYSSLRLYKYNSITAMTNPQRPEDAGGTGSAYGDEHDIVSKTDIVVGQVVAQDQIEANVGTTTYYINNPTNHTDKGISFAFEAANTTWRSKDKPYTNPTDGRKLINYRRNIFNTQYGGLSFNNRKQSQYIAASDIQDSGYTSVNCYGGDTYIGMFDYLYSSWEDGESASTQPEVIYFPVETSINLPLRLDDCYHRRYASNYSEFLHETAGVWTDGTNEFAQTDDLYRYNTVYSKENDTKIFIQAPFDWVPLIDFPVRTYASQIKITNEYADSWLRFGVNSYKDVDPQYGEITKLINVNNRLLYFQPKAFGVLSVNERALIETGTISQLSLGTSGVLDRFDYAKTQMGASSNRHVLLTSNALYWVDMINKSMYKYSGGPEEVSLMKGMDSFFRGSLVNSDSTFLFYDPEFREVCINDHTDNWTLVYNELVDSFTGFNDFFPTYVINYDDKICGTRDGYQFYRHNDSYADRGLLYGSYYPTSITLIVNPDNESTALFNNLEWFTEALNQAGIDVQVTFDEMTLYNDYQHSGIITLDSSNLKRRMRKWRVVLPRAIYAANGTTPLSVRNSRFRDSHLFVKLSYTNDANDRRFVSHDIITSFVVSNM